MRINLKLIFRKFIGHHPFPNFYSQHRYYNASEIKLGIFYALTKKFFNPIKIFLCRNLCILASIISTFCINIHWSTSQDLHIPRMKLQWKFLILKCSRFHMQFWITNLGSSFQYFSISVNEINSFLKLAVSILIAILWLE